MNIKTFNARPENINSGWIIFNAPRPLVGNKTWQGDFISGIFYAAVDPSDAMAHDFISNNEMNGAKIIEYTTVNKHVADIRAKVIAEYPEMADEVNGYSNTEIAEMYPLNADM